MEIEKNVRRVDIDCGDYPPLLKEIPDPPKQLYYRGDLSIASEIAVAVVGARKASEYGKWVSFHLSRTLAEHGAVVVSGMAAGVDSCAHKGALAAKGKTIAVLGCGVDICYPASNRKLMAEIIENGLVVSEYPPGTGARAYAFPLRNRIISGLSVGTVVAEAGNRSGSLITAERAAEQGRCVYAVPGNINIPSSIGCNKLIQDGATPIAFLDDVVSDLKLRCESTNDRRVQALGEDERALYEAVRLGGEVSMDELCEILKKTPQYVCGLVTVLEMKGVLYSAIGKVFVAK
ncbi:MAG: DNA-processing protein DprA [Clostridiales Family XIII bacterium]|jgi:DNA processing protein|nr:DNA-processing protein DprA [Clostridiales Family XIII bacterium]